MLPIGLAGAGMASWRHLLAWSAQSDRARVVAIADSSDATARRVPFPCQEPIAPTLAEAEALVAQDGRYGLAGCHEISDDAVIAHFLHRLTGRAPFETYPADKFETMRPVGNCYVRAVRS